MTNALLKDGNNGSMIDMEISKGSHVYVRTADGEHFIEWEDLTEDAKERCLQAQERISGAFEDARRDLEGIGV